MQTDLNGIVCLQNKINFLTKVGQTVSEELEVVVLKFSSISSRIAI